VCTGTSLMVIHYYSCMVTDNGLGFTDIRGTLCSTQLEGNRGVQTWKLPEKQPLIARGLLQVSAQRVWCNVGVVIMAVTRVTIIPSTLLYHLHDGAIDDEAERRAERSGDDVVAGHWHTPRHTYIDKKGRVLLLARKINQVNSPHSNVLFSRTSYRNYNGLERKYYNQYATVQQKVERVFQKLFRKTIRLNCPLCVTPSTSSKHIAATGCADKEKSAHQVYLYYRHPRRANNASQRERNFIY
jgi:hypothetical protein